MIESGGTEGIDYKALFEQVQTENEGIRIKYLKLKNDESSFIDHIKEWFSGLVEDEYFPLYLNIGVVLLVFIVAPLVGALFRFFARKGNTDVE